MVNVRVAVAQHGRDRLLFFPFALRMARLVDGFCQLADAAVFIKAVAYPQHGNGLVERLACGVDEFCGRRLAGGLGQPFGGGRGVVGGFRAAAQVPEYRTGLYRGELVFVPQQYALGVGGQGAEGGGHHFDIHHRGFVDHQYVQG